MKTETLESLIADREFGELPPEVVELLAAFLEHDAEAAERAATCREVLRLARTAVAQPATTPQRPLELPRIAPAVSRWPLPGWIMRATPLAACVVLGLALGWAVRPLEESGTAMSAHSVSSAPAEEASGRNNGLWTMQHFAPVIPVRHAAARATKSGLTLPWPLRDKTAIAEEIP